MTDTRRERAAARMARVPPYLFAEIDRRVAAKRAAGVDVIALDIGDPDRPTPRYIVEAARRALDDGANHRYASYYGLAELRQAMADWYRVRFGVALDPAAEVLPTLGAKDAIAHIPFALLDPGDVALVPDPGYPVYTTGAIMADAEAYPVPLTRANGWLPDLSAIPEKALLRARVLWLNYPNNPTASTAPLGFFREAVRFCRDHELVLCHDAPYTEVGFRGYRAPSVLQVEGSKDVAVEFHSLSKTFNMTGWRVGMLVGNADVVRLVGQVKTNVDSGIFQVVQRAAIVALEQPIDDDLNAVYAARQEKALDTFRHLGWRDLDAPEATFYLWLPVAEGYDSMSFAAHVLDEAGVNVTPGVGFGPGGEGYFRVSLTVADDRLDEALERLRRLTF